MQTHMWRFVRLTNTDGKTHAALLIMYKWLLKMENNVIKVGLLGWLECTTGINDEESNVGRGVCFIKYSLSIFRKQMVFD